MNNIMNYRSDFFLTSIIKFSSWIEKLYFIAVEDSRYYQSQFIGFLFYFNNNVASYFKIRIYDEWSSVDTLRRDKW